MLIDTHAHLYWDSYKQDFDEVIKRSLEAGVTTIINVGVDVNLSKIAAELESEKVKFYSTIGIHPHEATKYKSNKLSQDIKNLEEVYRENPEKVVAVGECGLDYAFSTSGESKPTPKVFIIKKLQIKLFQAQIDLAKKLNLPLIVHCRDDRSKDPTNSEAWNQTLSMVGSHPAILHCYSGLPHTTNYILHTTNLLVSFAATLTYPKNEYLRDAVKILPLEKIVLETDCPFLPPQSKRGQRNEPQTVKELAQLIADLKNLPFEKIAKQTTENVKRIFNIVAL